MKPVCAKCLSDDLMFEAYVRWDASLPATEVPDYTAPPPPNWKLVHVFNENSAHGARCEHCGAKGDIVVWKTEEEEE